MIGDDFPDIITRAQDGDQRAVEAIYRDLASMVIGYLRVNGSREPEDLAGDVFVDVIRGLGSFTGDEHRFRSWVFTITHRRLVDEFRRRGRRPEDPTPDRQLGELIIDLTDGEGEAMARLRARGVLEALEELSEDQRAVLYLRVVVDLPIAEVARLMGKAETAVKALQRRATLRMRHLLDGQLGPGDDPEGAP